MTGRGRLRLRPFLLLSAPLLPAVFLVALSGPASGRPAARTAAAQEGEKPDGETLYLRDCGVCHGPDGAGTPRGQDLRELGPAEVHYTVSTGRMPIQEPGDERKRREVRYSPEELTALIDHMRVFLDREPEIPEVDLEHAELAEGAELFSAECASCHQWAGQGGALLGKEAPSLSRASPTQIASSIRAGPSTMPEYGEDILSEHKVNSIVKYVLYLRQPEDRGGDGIWHLGPLSEGLVAWVVGLGVVVLALLWIGDRE